ncbi:holo-ACP synthase [Alcaligenes endophyticus]|uniref:Holo-[acyl-carrier-protein] synthase n=1 Tax=Alcaligenes endophyticus TaxID=1929088 RepID=A0ABT8EI55_9BURK|nr:holo-ACP synthase [Alcaligenes endophyticus]MCX5592780.1 holo-ACP synthase [Alcaligenes endophyticus]MDN4120968.1 holo-ACP synthase [Alcaligenes endophyticus]
MFDQAPTGIAGIGTDLIRIARIEQALARHGQRFVQRILGEQEQVIYARRSQRDPQRGVRYVAMRFAAKEAFSKAIGLGMRMPMAWSRMQTLNAPSGRPMVVLSGDLKTWYEARYGEALISLTDETDMAMAFVIVQARSAT